LSEINEIDIFSIADAAFELFSYDARGQQESCVGPKIGRVTTTHTG
jgi:hypothetical protein